MPADGLTKILTRQKHASFVRQLGLSDISARLEPQTDSEDTVFSSNELGGCY
jgi:hypothetical protein